MGDTQERVSVSSSSSSSSSAPSLSALAVLQPIQEPLQIDEESWMFAEDRANEILCTIQPVVLSDRSRYEIIEYLRNLIKTHDGIEVFSFGSVPLKTYLPDGDIDLTVLTRQNMDEAYYNHICSVLQFEGPKSEFYAKDVQFVPAQVKVIKCTIRNIAVDISFNQTTGLCALCFLEQVDQLFGRDHLFKRSIILVKAWCYYESRILGANTGLISTYALAILVLYIINLYHASISGPLGVLQKFLDYYAVFDWSKYCVSINGPVPIASLPDLTVSPEDDGNTLLLDEKFLQNCIELYVPNKPVETNHHLMFPIRRLNIIDPLKHSNNIGKSVTQGNFQRIKHAFTLGSKSLRDILSLPGEAMGWRIERFFTNSLDRNGKGQRQDVKEPVTAFGTGRAELSQLRGDFEGNFARVVYGQMYHGYTLPGGYQHSYIPVAAQVQESSAWDVVRRLMTYRKNELYLRGLNASNSIQQTFPQPSFGNSFQNMGRPRGTGTYIPDMRQQLYLNNYRGPSIGGSSTHHFKSSLKPSPLKPKDEAGANSSRSAPSSYVIPSSSRNVPSSSVIPSSSRSAPSSSVIPSSNRSVPSSNVIPSSNRNVPSSNVILSSNRSVPSCSVIPSSNRNAPSSSGIPSSSRSAPSSYVIPSSNRNVPSSNVILSSNRSVPSCSVIPSSNRNAPSSSGIPSSSRSAPSSYVVPSSTRNVPSSSVIQSSSRSAPSSYVIPSSSRNVSSSSVIPSSSRSPPSSYVIPSSSLNAPFSSVIPSNSRSASSSYVIPSSSRNVSSSYVIPSNTRNVPSFVMPSSTRNVPSSSVIPSGSRNVPTTCSKAAKLEIDDRRQSALPGKLVEPVPSSTSKDPPKP